MDEQVGTADGQRERLQVLGVGQQCQVYLEGMDRCYTQEPLVIQVTALTWDCPFYRSTTSR